MNSIYKMNPSQSIVKISAAVLLGASLLMSGCAHFGRGPQDDQSFERDSGAALTTQYAPSSGARTGFNTFEVYLRNDSDKPVRYGCPRLNGKPLLDLALSRVTAPADVKLDGVQIPFPRNAWHTDPLVTWWQYYPGQDAAPGETVVLQINLRQSVTSQRMLEIPEIGGVSHTATVSRFHMPDAALSAVTFTPDFKRMYVQVTAQKEAKRVWVNGDEVKTFRLMRRAELLDPDMLAVTPPKPVSAGMPLHVKVEFADGRIRQELLRALAGISLDTQARLPADERARYSLDDDPAVVMLEGDVTCSDTYGHRKGSSAPRMAADRTQFALKHKNKLAGLGYCTAIYPELWNIYGPIADAVYAKPYQLGWGYRKMKFLEEEEDAMRSTALTAAPRPMLWIPQRLCPVGGRHLEAAELDLLGWLSLVRGGKGLRYHQWRPAGEPDGFKDCPWLKPAISNLNQVVHSKEPLLSALALESERKQEDAPGCWSKVYTAWSGEAGMLVMIRNLNYEAESLPPAGSKGPYFRVKKRSQVSIPVTLPSWLKAGDPVDFLSGKQLPQVTESGVMRVTLPELGAFALVWVANCGQ
jgi:hypothetical protein